MKKLPLIIFTLFIISKSYSQLASTIVQSVYSENGQYQVQVKGGFYEGFAGPQKISLIAGKDTLWQQVVPRRFLIMPSVSNLGDVAITHREIKIFDKTNHIKGTFSLQKKQSPFNWGDYQGAVHGFSIKGDKYFIFMFTGTPDIEFICLSDSANEIWRRNLGKYEPCKMTILQNMLIVDDFCHSGIKYSNYCYIFNLNGEFWKYGMDKVNPPFSKVEIDQKNNILLIKKKSSIIKEVKFDTLNYKSKP